MDRVNHPDFELREGPRPSLHEHPDEAEQFRRLALHDELSRLKDGAGSASDFAIRAIELLFATIDCERIDIGFYNSEKDLIDYPTLADPSLLANTEGRSVALGESVLASVVRDGKTIRCQGQDWEPASDSKLHQLAKTGVRAFLAVPIAARDQTFGAIACSSFSSDEVSKQDLALTEVVASAVAEALQAEDLEIELTLARGAAAAAAILENASITSKTTGEFLSEACGRAREILFAESACVCVIGASGSFSVFGPESAATALALKNRELLLERLPELQASSRIGSFSVTDPRDESEPDPLALGFKQAIWAWFETREGIRAALCCGTNSGHFRSHHRESLSRFAASIARLLERRSAEEALLHERALGQLQARVFEIIESGQSGLCQKLVDETGHSLNLARCYLLRVNASARTVSVAEQYHRDSLLPVDVSFSYDDLEILLGRLHAGELVVTDYSDVKKQGGQAPSDSGSGTVSSVTYVPVIVDSQLVSALIIEDYGRDDGLTIRERTVLGRIASRLADSMKADSLRRRIVEQRELAGVLNRLTSAIREVLDFDTLISTLVTQLAVSARLDLCAILLVPPGKSLCKTVAQHHTPAVDALPGEFDFQEWGRLFDELREGKILVFDPATNDPRASMVFATRFKSHGFQSVAAIPVLQDRSLTAVILAATSQSSRVWHQEDLDLLGAVADQMAISLSQAEMLRQLKAQADRAALLNRITNSIRQSLDTGTVLQTTVEELAVNFQLDRCSFYRLDAAEGIAVIEHQYCAPGVEPVQGQQYHLDEWAPVLKAVEDGEVFASDDVMYEPSLALLYQQYFRPSGSRSVLYVPILSEGKVAAVIVAVQCRYRRHWTNEESAFFLAVAGQVSIAMKQSQLHQRIKSQADREALLNHIVRESRGILDIEQAIRVVTGEVRKVLGVERCLLWEPEGGGSFRTRGADAEPGYELEPRFQVAASDSSFLVEIGKSLKPWAIENTYVDPLCESYRPLLESLGVRSLLAAPVSSGDDGPLGVLSIHQCRSQRSWTLEEVELVQALARELAVTIRIAQLYQASEDKKRELAGLYEISKTFSSVSDVRETYEQLTRQLASLTRAEICFLASFDSVTGAVIAQSPGFGIDADSLSKFSVTIDPSLAHRSRFHAGHTHYCNDLGSDSTLGKGIAEDLGLRSLLVAPMKARDQIAGFIFLFNRPDGFSAEDADLLSIYATHAAEAVTSAQLFHQTQKQIEYEELLNRITSSIRQSLDFEVTCQTVVQSLRQNLGLSVCAVAEASGPETLSVRASACAQDEAWLGERLELDDVGPRVAGELRGGRSLTVTLKPDSESEPGPKPCSAILSPILVESRLKAVLIAGDVMERQWTDSEASLLTAVSGQLAVAIIQSELHREVKERAERESLFNRISSAMSQSLDLPVVLQSAVDELGPALKVDACIIESFDGSDSLVTCYSRDGVRIPDQFIMPEAEPGPEISIEPGALHVRVRLADMALGAIRLVDLEGTRHWTEYEIELIRHLADHLSIVIHNAKLFAEAQRTARDLAVLNNISNAARRCVELTDVLEEAVREVGKAIGAGTARILMCGASSAAAVLSNEYRKSGEPSPGPRDLSLQDNLIVRRMLIDKSKEVITSDPRNGDAGVRALLGGSPEDASVLATPLVSADEAIGILSLAFEEPHVWTQQETDMVAAAADQIASIIRQMKLYESLEESAKEAIALYKAISALASSPSLEELLSEIVRVMTDVLDYRNCAILLIDEEHKDLYFKAARGYPEDVLRMRLPIDGPSVTSRVAATGQMVYVPDVTNCEDFIPGTAETKSELALPLVIDGELLGVMDVESDRLDAFHERDFTVLNSFAQKVALAIRQARLFDQVSLGKEQWEATFNAMKDSLFIYDREAKLIRTNTAADRLLRSPRPHVWRTDDAPSSPAFDDGIVNQAIETRQTVSIERGYPPVNKPYHITVYPILDDTGNVVGAVKIARDLTDLRRAEKRAKETQDFAAELVENGFDAIYILDPEGCFKWMNKQTSKIYGYSANDLVGTNFASLFVHEDLEAAVTAFQRALDGTGQVYEARITPKNGQFRNMMFTSSPFRRNGRIVGALVIARDVTEQKEIQASSARSEKMRALGELASGVAHDFNNILAAILGRAQLLRSQVKDDHVLRSIDVITQAAEDGSHTIKRIQNFARRRLERNFEVVSLSTLIHDVIDITRTHWKDNAERAGKKIEMKTRLADGVFVAVDPSELREVFINLLINAVDAMAEGGEISISTSRVDDEALIEVRDTGHGMPEDVRNKIFDPFFTTKGARGTGLGLSVSYGIINRHGGTIEVQSEVGKGTCFVISLPAKDVDEQEAAPEVFESVKPARILCIDDEPTVRDVLAEILQGDGHTVELADSGVIGLKMLKEQPFDLVFTDLGMPEMNGWEVAGHIKEQYPGLPVVMSTGWGEEIDREQAAREGVWHVVSKPFRIDEIFAIVARCLNSGEARDEEVAVIENERDGVDEEFAAMPTPDCDVLIGNSQPDPDSTNLC